MAGAARRKVAAGLAAVAGTALLVGLVLWVPALNEALEHVLTAYPSRDAR